MDGVGPSLNGHRSGSHNAVIEQAAALLTGQLGVDLHAAMDELHAYALSTNQPLVDVAREVLARRLTLPPVPDVAREGPGQEPHLSAEAAPKAMTLQLQPGIASLRVVRVFLHQACAGVLSPERVHDAELLGTELIVNALRHGAAPIWIEVDRAGHAVRIAVCDRGSARPRLCSATSTDESGRGLALLRALSEQWGVTELDRGKSVWFTLAGRT